MKNSKIKLSVLIVLVLCMVVSFAMPIMTSATETSEKERIVADLKGIRDYVAGTASTPVAPGAKGDLAPANQQAFGLSLDKAIDILLTNYEADPSEANLLDITKFLKTWMWGGHDADKIFLTDKLFGYFYDFVKFIEEKDIKDPEDPYERLLLSIKRGDHILVSGATSTGKTTFLNNLLKILDINKRIVTIEDTRELLVPHPNRVHLVLSRTEQTNEMDYAKIIDLVVRFTPDAIIGGEISTSNAGAIWELMGSGHDNCLATIHAESSEAAYKAFTDRILHTYPTIDRNKTIEEMHHKLRVVQINRDGNLRAITEVT